MSKFLDYLKNKFPEVAEGLRDISEAFESEGETVIPSSIAHSFPEKGPVASRWEKMMSSDSSKQPLRKRSSLAERYSGKGNRATGSTTKENSYVSAEKGDKKKSEGQRGIE